MSGNSQATAHRKDEQQELKTKTNSTKKVHLDLELIILFPKSSGGNILLLCFCSLLQVHIINT